MKVKTILLLNLIKLIKRCIIGFRLVHTVVKGVGVVSLFVGIYPLELCACRVVLNVYILLHLYAGHLVVLVVANLHLPHHHRL